MKHMPILANSLLLALQLLSASVKADIDEDFVDLSFECPFKAVCPQVCVATPFDCPTSMQCPDNTALCADGSCAEVCNPSLTSPCPEDCAPIACPLVIDYYDNCIDLYAPLLQYAANCSNVPDVIDAEIGTGSRFSWSDPIYIAGYCWIGGVTMAMIGWCWFNHRLAPPDDATKVLQMNGEIKNGVSTKLTGYKRHPIGMVLYWWTIATYVVWLAMLTALGYLYYEYGDDDDDVLMILNTFCLVWNVGILWCLILQWPYSNESLFLRRCPLEEATHVAVYHPTNQLDTQGTNITETSMVPIFVENILKLMAEGLRSIMCLIFADPNARPNRAEGILEYCPVHHNPDGSRYFVFLFRRYNFDENDKIFVQGEWSVGKTFKEMAPAGMHKVYDFELQYEQAIRGEDPKGAVSDDVFDKLNCLFAEGLSSKDVEARQMAIGKNVIEMPKPSYLKAIRDELMKPFYIYQFFILWIWLAADYWYMSVVAWGIILMTACLISWFRYRGALVLYGVSDVSGTATVLRDDKTMTISQKELVPGDIVALSVGICHCDLVLLDGEVLVDESALTGEATPQAKAPIDPMSQDVYDPQNHKRQTISAGTRILECDGSLGLVVKTASYTTKGELLRDIIAFRHYIPQHERELPTAILILVVWSSCSFLFTMLNSSDIPIVAWSLALTTFSNAFPALLPISFTVPVGISFNRLAKNGIACANSDSILIAGRVSRAFFDKTGTLTKQGLDYVSCRSARSWDLGNWTSSELDVAMATCHSLIKSKAGDLIGNPVDLAMFKASLAKLTKVTGTTVVIKDSQGSEMTVLRRFDFDHNTMTQSVIVRLEDGSLKVIVKGSGENVVVRCEKESIPSTFEEKLRLCSRVGIYQIAVASKTLPSDTNVATLSRGEVESNLSFLGVLNFSNTMREETPGVIRQLAAANVQSIMMTGDNIFTGIHIARLSGLIRKGDEVILCQVDKEGQIQWTTESSDSVAAPTLSELKSGTKGQALAMSGSAWCKLLQTDREQAVSLVPFVRVFARCSPHDKVSVVDTFVSLGSTTFMCGDGGNDCGALKAAHVGLALSDSDASIVAPFTSLDKDITAVLTLLKEGRAALASTMATYKFVIMYGQISSYNQFILYKLTVSLSDWMWTFIDGVWTVSFSLTLPRALPALTLSMNRPTASILGMETVSSVAGMVVIHYIFMSIALAVLYSEDWFQCRKWDSGGSILTNALFSGSDNYEAEVIFLVSSMQVLSTAMTLNVGYEFRRNWFRNWVFVVLVLGFLVMIICITLLPSTLSCVFRTNCSNDNVVRSILDSEPQPINNSYNTTIMPVSFRIKMVCILLSNCIAIGCFDYLVVNGLRRRATSQTLHEVLPFGESRSSSDNDDTMESPSLLLGT